MIGVSTQVIDTKGTIVFKEHPSTELENFSRRIQRTSTLDGGVTVEDLGYADVDRKVVIVAEASEELMEHLEYLIKNYATINLSTVLGFNTTGIKALSLSSGKIKITCELIT